ncbi:MAG: sarcosine oxidase subunit gamma family protein [Pseudomonadota bacterium]
MPELIAKSALDGRQLTLGGVTLAEVDVGPITSVALYPGGAKPANKGLKPLGLSMPGPNEMQTKGAARIIWTGRDQAFLLGVAAPVLEGAAVTDQSGGWTCLSITGPASVEVLARLLPLDLRLAAFPVGTAARAPLNHMNAVVIRSGDTSFDLLVFRSMARTAWHELAEAAQAVAARAAVR